MDVSLRSGLRAWWPWMLVLRLAAGGLAAWVGTGRPFTLVEALLPLWPPRAPWELWLARAALAPWLRWDAVYYVRILTQGYALADGTAQFHPLYPLLAWPLTYLGLNPLLALLLVATLAQGVFLALLADTWRDLPPQRLIPALMLAPFAIFWLLPYTEPVFLVWAMVTFRALWHRRWAWAGWGAALATLTRQQGVFLLVPIAWTLWEQRREVRWWTWGVLALAPLAWAGWIAYRAWALGDWQPQVTSLQSTIYSILISGSAHQVVPEQAFVWPWEALRRAWLHMLVKPDLDMGINLVLAGLLVGLLALAWKKLTAAEKLYSLVLMAVSLAYYTGPVHPYMGLPRHMLLAFPLLRGVEPILWRRRAFLAWLGLGTCLTAFLVMAYGLMAWVP